MYSLFLIVCGLLTLVTPILSLKASWTLSLLPLSISPLLLASSGAVITDLSMWVVATLVITSLPLVILKDYNNKSTTFMNTMAILCIVCIVEIILLIFQVLGYNIIPLLSILVLLAWFSILYTLLREPYDYIKNTLYTTLHRNSLKLYSRQNCQNTRLVSTGKNKT